MFSETIAPLSFSINQVDWLTYCSYAHNRNHSPHISPERWRKIYHDAETYEKIYQSKIKNTEDFTDDYTNYRYA